MLDDVCLAEELQQFVSAIVRGPDNDDATFGLLVLKTYIFVNINTGKLVSAQKFNESSTRYPCVIPRNQRLGSRVLRHDIVALFRSADIDRSEIEAREGLAGHHHKTGFSTYTVNNQSSEGKNANTFMKYRATLEWIKWLGLETGHHKNVGSGDDIVELVSENHPYWAVPKNHCGLSKAGADLLSHSFGFRDGQFEIAADILCSSSPAVPIMALPGYSKTLLYQLPMVVLNQHSKNKFVSFAFVPYVGLLKGTHIRSSKNLKVDYVKSLFGASWCGLRKGVHNIQLVDVYVGTYNDMVTIEGMW